MSSCIKENNLIRNVNFWANKFDTAPVDELEKKVFEAVARFVNKGFTANNSKERIRALSEMKRRLAPCQGRLHSAITNFLVARTRALYPNQIKTPAPAPVARSLNRKNIASTLRKISSVGVFALAFIAAPTLFSRSRAEEGNTGVFTYPQDRESVNTLVEYYKELATNLQCVQKERDARANLSPEYIEAKREELWERSHELELTLRRGDPELNREEKEIAKMPNSPEKDLKMTTHKVKVDLWKEPMEKELRSILNDPIPLPNRIC
ncbi:MAG: hypothetical protein JSS32_06535 [Verrucomicrobia bacterium]|nr:hypothetical protein [Verrucomicrobiota bacterium]